MGRILYTLIKQNPTKATSFREAHNHILVFGTRTEQLDSLRLPLSAPLRLPMSCHKPGRSYKRTEEPEKEGTEKYHTDAVYDEHSARVLLLTMGPTSVQPPRFRLTTMALCWSAAATRRLEPPPLRPDPGACCSRMHAVGRPPGTSHPPLPTSRMQETPIARCRSIGRGTAIRLIE